MTKKKKRWIIIGAIFGGILEMVVIIIALPFAASFPWAMIYLDSVFGEHPPQPEVSYGEFPFEFVYEVNGERNEIRDTLVIEHVGVGWDEGHGKHNDWNVYFKDATVRLIHQYSDDYAINLPVDGYEGLQIYLGSCQYFMGLDDSTYLSAKGFVPGDVYDTSTMSIITDNELYHRFGIKIIEVQMLLPITERGIQ